MAASVVLCISNNDNVLDLENDDLFRGFITWNTFVHIHLNVLASGT